MSATLPPLTTALRAALGARLDAALQASTLGALAGCAVQSEGLRFTRPTGRPWIRGTLRVGGTVPDTIGPHARLTTVGLWLVDVFTPANTGTADSDTLADAVVLAFPPGLDLALPNAQAADGVLRLTGASRGGAIPDAAGWLMAPCTVSWRTHTTNSI
ncbi:hypothetical protein J421_4660 (plasmid) [Gemmatirosa kalamazoonensis]|uniref:Uncharacterized protein n=1 Tax=Gemmatirosa kalamazoonensis TaxID=861299 RepID=W0RPE6_9BACT|nr:DUF4128 domain-containing protein [Gemmatirosa kalamazoonensis]AHG92127.1 hypothetical protein J421_4592 [Gemmatirosa kalamazoonensis]AHG92195.1 hypothetical protein J421_4660 [Gemmatirosa kalamazoonensis]